MCDEFEAFHEIITHAGDHTAAFCTESLLKLLESKDCVDLEKFCTVMETFPDASSVSSIISSSDVMLLKKSFVRRFWMASGWQFAKEIAQARPAEIIKEEEEAEMDA